MMKRAVFVWILPIALGAAHPARAERPVAPKPAVAPVASPATAALPATISLDLKEAKAPEVERALCQALGIDVRLDGYLLRPITLKLESVPRDEALRQIATAIDGSWRRVHSWSGGTGEPVSTKTTSTVRPRLTGAPCASAAALIASSAGAWAEGHTKLAGKVTFDGTDLPVAEALARIAKASGASCRDMIVFRTKGFEERERVNAAKAAEKGEGKQRRTKYTVLGKYGAKAGVPDIIDPEEAEARAQLGAFAGIFGTTDRAERLQRVRKLRASMETQNRRQETYRPEHRTLAASFEMRHLKEMLADYELLTDEQKKDVKVLVDYVKKRVAKLEGVLGPNGPKLLFTPRKKDDAGKQ
jgi:hypothetical protein